MDTHIIPLMVFTLFSYTAAGFSGFGAMIIPVTLGAHIYSIKWMLSILVPVSPFGNMIILVRHHRHINWQILLKKLFPAMLVGLVLGIAIFQYIPESILKRAFGVLVIIVSLLQLYKIRQKSLTSKPIGPVATLVQFLLAGIVHGIFATGGPILVYVISRLNFNKSQFRSTLTCVWMVMNSFLTIAYFSTGRLTVETAKGSALMIIPLCLGLFVGEMLHNRINEERFRVVIYIFLLLTGISILIK